MTRERALVQRTGRKIHWASRDAGDHAWLTLCDRDVPVFGLREHGRDWPSWLTAAQDYGLPLCSRCRTALLTAGLALAEVEEVRAANLDREAMLAELLTLRAERSEWVTAALYETRRAVPASWRRDPR